jgi:hypothetical protein
MVRRGRYLGLLAAASAIAVAGLMVLYFIARSLASPSMTLRTMRGSMAQPAVPGVFCSSAGPLKTANVKLRPYLVAIRFPKSVYTVAQGGHLAISISLTEGELPYVRAQVEKCTSFLTPDELSSSACVSLQPEGSNGIQVTRAPHYEKCQLLHPHQLTAWSWYLVANSVGSQHGLLLDATLTRASPDRSYTRKRSAQLTLRVTPNLWRVAESVLPWGTAFLTLLGVVVPLWGRHKHRGGIEPRPAS